MEVRWKRGTKVISDYAELQSTTILAIRKIGAWDGAKIRVALLDDGDWKPVDELELYEELYEDYDT